MKIDYRRESVDPYCLYCPKVVIGDGTHIGVSLRNMSLEKACTDTDLNEVYKVKHKRADRCLIKPPKEREHFRLVIENFFIEHLLIVCVRVDIVMYAIDIVQVSGAQDSRKTTTQEAQEHH